MFFVKSSHCIVVVKTPVLADIYLKIIEEKNLCSLLNTKMLLNENDVLKTIKKQ